MSTFVQPVNTSPGLNLTDKGVLLVILLSALYAYAAQVVGSVVFGVVGLKVHSLAVEFALRIGLPKMFVAEFISFALLQLPGWFVLGLTTFVLGATRWQRAKLFCFSLSILFPFIDVARFIVFCWSSGLRLPDPGLFWTKNVCIPFLATPIGIACWYLGSLDFFRMSKGRAGKKTS